MDADGGDVQFPPRRPLVQRLNVLQNVLELEAGRGNQSLGQPVKHEGIVRIRRMTEC